MFFVFVTLALLATVLGEDFCRPGLCEPPQTHLGCNNNGSLASVCPIGSQLLDITPYKKRILRIHNQKRNQVAGGLIPNLSTAVRMATMQWDNDLAYLASLKVKTCVFGGKECRNTEKYHFVGRNLAKNSWSGLNPTISSIIQDQVTEWTRLNSPPSTSNVPLTFGVMINQLSTRVGCGALKSLELTNGTVWQTFTLACYYSHTNVIGFPVYISGPIASQCTTGTNPLFKNLCSINEVYNVNVPLR